MNNPRLQASLSLDLDNLWAYLKIHGDQRWRNFPSYLDTFIPEFLELLDELSISITFFIVGQDAHLKKNKEALKLIVERGHEVGNHTFHHEICLQRYSKDQLKQEILLAEEAIIETTGQKPRGFRGPGFAWTPLLIQVLQELGYQYDSTLFPTFIGPIARFYYNWNSNLGSEVKKSQSKLFGSFKNGFLPLSPYLWELSDNSSFLELPISTTPLLKLPFHMSYLLYLCGFSKKVMNLYLNFSIQTCLLKKISPNFLLHPTDILGSDRITEMNFFPGMNLCSSYKKEIFIEIISKLKQNFELVNMSNTVKIALQNKELLIKKKLAFYE